MNLTCKILLFMHKVKNNETPNIFNNKFSKLENKFNTRLFEHNFTKPLYKNKLAQYTIITFGWPQLWNSIVPTDYEKYSFQLFKSKINSHCFNIINEK